MPTQVQAALWRGNQLAAQAEAVVPSGWPGLDAQLPGAGWPCRSICELLSAQPGVVEWRLLCPALRQMTRGGAQVVVIGEAVQRNEFGINKGLFWNDNGDKLAFYRMDQSQVADYPLIDYKPVPAIVKNIKYPMAGQTSHFVTIGIYDIKMGSILYLNTGLPADQYLTNIAWDPSGEYIYVAVINRDKTT